jgi:hypothetical protein
MTTGRQHMMVWFAAGTGAAAIERHQILLSQVPAPGQLRRPGGGTGAEHLDRSGAGRQHPGGDAQQGGLVGAVARPMVSDQVKPATVPPGKRQAGGFGGERESLPLCANRLRPVRPARLPGAVILYALIAVLAWPARSADAKHAHRRGQPGRRLLEQVRVACALGQLRVPHSSARRPGSARPARRHSGNAAGEAGWLGALDRNVAAAVGSHGAIALPAPCLPFSFF